MGRPARNAEDVPPQKQISPSNSKSLAPLIDADVIRRAADKFHEESKANAEAELGMALRRVGKFWLPVQVNKHNQIAAQELYKDVIFRYMSDIDNEFPKRNYLATEVLGLKTANMLYRIFTPDDLLEIEQECFRLRRLRYSRELALVDMAMFKAAQTGDVSAAKLVYERFEGAVAKTLNLNHSGEIALKALLTEIGSTSATQLIEDAIEVTCDEESADE